MFFKTIFAGFGRGRQDREENPMAIWQWGLLLLAAVWALQALGVWFQMSHYSGVMKGITDTYKDGFVGAGNFRGSFSKGAIALVLVTPDLVVRRVLLMSGRTVFTRFKRYEQFEGLPLERLRADPSGLGLPEPGMGEAVKRAVEQIDRARAEPARQPGLSGLSAAHA